MTFRHQYEVLAVKRNDKGKITAILLHTFKRNNGLTGCERRYYNKYYIEKVFYVFGKKIYIPLMRFKAPVHHAGTPFMVSSTDEICILFYWNVVDKWWKKLYGRL